MDIRSTFRNHLDGVMWGRNVVDQPPIGCGGAIPLGVEVCRKIRRLLLIANLREMKNSVLRDWVMIQSALPRKISKLMNIESVPQTDTGDQVE